MFTFNIYVKAETREGFVLNIANKTFGNKAVAVNKSKGQIEIVSNNAEALVSIVGDISVLNAKSGFNIGYSVKNG